MTTEYLRPRVYRTAPQCESDGHLMDDGSLPTCTRKGCDEGMQMVDFYLDLEVRMCRCVGEDNSRCLPHNERFHSMEGIDEYDRLEAARS